MQKYDAVGQVPESMRIRLLSRRTYNRSGMMLDAEVVAGTEIEHVVVRMLADPNVSHLHVHHARQGCYAVRIDRA
ncbi:DUF1203 domain-containing protein [Pseudomonas huanghezhanensis]|uniref:DUF1203 domain-containing protein n=1 Tax=Pseudomonas huanghezhanensis TaxID=3002903 RepID=UPI0022867C9F|nr:DUF1203 domain-containing protein [Pseudomonas sp. BSw22131]